MSIEGEQRISTTLCICAVLTIHLFLSFCQNHFLLNAAPRILARWHHWCIWCIFPTLSSRYEDCSGVRKHIRKSCAETRILPSLRQRRKACADASPPIRPAISLRAVTFRPGLWCVGLLPLSSLRSSAFSWFLFFLKVSYSANFHH
jgi:hypothetical protein